jgi:hypothetical protein
LRKASIFANSYDSLKCLEAIRLAEQEAKEVSKGESSYRHSCILAPSKGLLQPHLYLRDLKQKAGFRKDGFATFPSHCERHPFSRTVTILKCLEAICLAEQNTKECSSKGKVVIGMLTLLTYPRDCFNPIAIIGECSINQGFRKDGLVIYFPWGRIKDF